MQAHQGAWGSKLGPRVAMLVSQSIVYTHSKLLHLKHKLAMMVFHAISDEISEEVDVTLGPFLQQLHDTVPEDHPAFPGIHFMHTASGQLKALAGTGMQISGLLGTVSTVLNNALAPYVYNIVSQSPGMLPDQTTIVQAFASQMISREEGRGDLGGQGIQFDWADRMLTLGITRPSPADALEMVRRGLITDDQFTIWGALNGIDPIAVGNYLQMRNSPVSTPDAALAVLRGNMTQAEGEKIAAENGMNADSFKTLIDNTGEPPGLQQLLEAYRRGFIDQETLKRGILQSRYRNEWIPMLEKLRYSPMSVSDAVRAVVQNQLDISKARTIADDNGLEPGAFDVLAATEGDPLSRTEMEELFNRGLVSQSQVDQALRESRVKNKYVNLAFELHRRVLPLRNIQMALHEGSMDQGHAIAAIMENGYSHDDAAQIVKSGNFQRLRPYRDQVVSAIRSLYEDNLVSKDMLVSTVMSMDFTADEAVFIAQSSEMKREQHLTETAITAVRNKYLGHHIDVNAASGYLDGFGIPATQRDQLLALWQIEAGAFTRTLTEAQVVKAFKHDLITAEDAGKRLIAMGYNETDATLLLQGA